MSKKKQLRGLFHNKKYKTLVAMLAIVMFFLWMISGRSVFDDMGANIKQTIFILTSIGIVLLFIFGFMSPRQIMRKIGGTL